MAGSSLDRAWQHHRAGELDKAVALYRHALRTLSGAEASRVGQMLGAALHLQGLHDQAEEALRAAVRAEPPPALGARRGLVTLLVHEARMDDAVAVMRECAAAATGKGPGIERDARLALAMQLAEARRADEAMTLLEALAAQAPDHPAVQLELARLSERLGRRDQASAAAERAIAAAPESADARFIAARIDATAGRLEQARARLEALLSALPEQRRGVIMIELARVLDRLGISELAFEMARRGQAASLAGLAPASRDGTRHERVIDDCLRISEDAVKRWNSPSAPGDGSASGAVHESPVFVVGFPRSGTTLIEQMLAAHPRLVVTDELPLLQRTREKMFLRFRPRGEYPRDLGEFTAEQVLQARRWYLERAVNAIGAGRLREVGDGRRRIVDKQPLNTVDACFVRLIFPESPVIFVQRDARDVVLSCFMQGFTRGVPHLFSLEGTARLYDRFMTVWGHYERVLGLRSMRLGYEDLVREPEAQLRRLLEFIGEPWHDAVLRSHEAANRRYVTTPSYGDVTQPVYTRAVGRWRSYRVQLSPVMETLEKWTSGD